MRELSAQLTEGEIREIFSPSHLLVPRKCQPPRQRGPSYAAPFLIEAIPESPAKVFYLHFAQKRPLIFVISNLEEHPQNMV